MGRRLEEVVAYRTGELPVQRERNAIHEGGAAANPPVLQARAIGAVGQKFTD